jgi:hypothetical protein
VKKEGTISKRKILSTHNKQTTTHPSKQTSRETVERGKYGGRKTQAVVLLHLYNENKTRQCFLWKTKKKERMGGWRNTKKEKNPKTGTFVTHLFCHR